ncbi:MAG: hypothetical protein R3264_21855, partial [Anaerolineae bacterium]|nr:hypothetical protein [Anaerolineae bacterium]
MTPHPLYRSLRRLRATFWRRRVLHWLVRSTWLTLLVPVLIIGGYYWRGWEIPATYLIWGMVGVAGLVILWAVRPIRLGRMVNRLDKRLDLQTRLTTAHEVTDPHASADAENPVVQRLLQ